MGIFVIRVFERMATNIISPAVHPESCFNPDPRSLLPYTLNVIRYPAQFYILDGLPNNPVNILKNNPTRQKIDKLLLMVLRLHSIGCLSSCILSNIHTEQVCYSQAVGQSKYINVYLSRSSLCMNDQILLGMQSHFDDSQSNISLPDLKKQPISNQPT